MSLLPACRVGLDSKQKVCPVDGKFSQSLLRFSQSHTQEREADSPGGSMAFLAAEFGKDLPQGPTRSGFCSSCVHWFRLGVIMHGRCYE